jgi:hypothetical protein
MIAARLGADASVVDQMCARVDGALARRWGVAHRLRKSATGI